MRRPTALVALMLATMIAVVGACSKPPEPKPPAITETVTTTTAAPSALAVFDAGPSFGAPPVIRLRYRGANVSGAEDGTTLPGKAGTDFKWPSAPELGWVAAQGMNIVRLPFLHERAQPKLSGPVDETYLAGMDAAVKDATGRGLVVILEAHNSFRFRGAIVTDVQIGDLWGRIAERYKGNPRVWVSPTNEPHDMTTEAVVALDNAVTREVRRIGFTGVVVAPGNAFTGAAHWTETYYGTPNAKAMLGLLPDLATAIEVHVYLDADESGNGKDCVSQTIGVERLAPFVAWLRTNGKVGIIGEIGAPNTPTCALAVAKSLAFIEANYDVLIGWLWWQTGVWSAQTLPLSIGGPLGARPQLAWLAPFLPACPTRTDGGI